ncbi:hypothetical protein HNY73_002432 [Argiope bruennichi]|uniref:Uncharacterized protein n=1 Tax=Argiope bruennichi TaxID=94029 RepID=A0A8T0FUT1_ARGBR|nr:hypothetical protein HNY73_002432 [Argiope bruennichi]
MSVWENKVISLFNMKFPEKLWLIVNDCDTGAIGWGLSGDTIALEPTTYDWVVFLGVGHNLDKHTKTERSVSKKEVLKTIPQRTPLSSSQSPNMLSSMENFWWNSISSPPYPTNFYCDRSIADQGWFPMNGSYYNSQTFIKREPRESEDDETKFFNEANVNENQFASKNNSNMFYLVVPGYPSAQSHDMYVNPGIIKNGIKCIQDYASQCGTDMIAENFHEQFERPAEFLTKICDSSSPIRNDYLKASPCLHEKSDDLEVCSTKVQEFLAILDEPDTNEKELTLTCMYEMMLRACLMSTSAEKCGLETAVFIRKALLYSPSLGMQTCSKEVQSHMLITEMVTVAPREKSTQENLMMSSITVR